MAPTGIVVDRTSGRQRRERNSCERRARALVHIGSSTVVGNGGGLITEFGGQIFSYQNNQAAGNFIDGAPSGTLALK